MDHNIEISSDGGRSDYEFQTTGSIRAVDAEGGDDVDDDHVAGSVNGGSDTYKFNGVMKDFRWTDGEDNGTVKVDGAVKHPSHLTMHTATIESDPGANYGIASTGELIRSTANGGSIGALDQKVSNTELEGYVHGGVDTVRFQGGLTMFWCDNDAILTVDGNSRFVEGTPPEGQL